MRSLKSWLSSMTPSRASGMKWKRAHVDAGEVGQEEDVEHGAVEVEVRDAGVLEVDVEGVVEAVHHLDVEQLGHLVGVVEQASEVGLVGFALVGQQIDSRLELLGLVRSEPLEHPEVVLLHFRESLGADMPFGEVLLLVVQQAAEQVHERGLGDGAGEHRGGPHGVQDARRSEASPILRVARPQDFESVDEHMLVAVGHLGGAEHQGQEHGLFQRVGAELVVDLRREGDELLDGEELARVVGIDHPVRIRGKAVGLRMIWQGSSPELS